jgi:hypothetical protein
VAALLASPNLDFWVGECGPDSGRKKTMLNWVTSHRRIAAVLLLQVAALNFWIAYTRLVQHPTLALMSAGTAAIITIGVVLTW